jgi:tRNA/rRNA methyltransferase
MFRRQPIGSPAQIMPHAVDSLREDRPTALLFGPEPTGLSNEIIARCHHVIQIPTAAEYASLNLAQAVAVCIYELHEAWLTAAGKDSSPPELAAVEMQERMFDHLRTALEYIHFLYGDKADSLMHALRHLLGKARLTEMEVKVLLGLARQIRWFAAHHVSRETRAESREPDV